LHLAHKGHRNLLIRGLATLGNAILTGVVLGYGIDIPHQSLFLICQLGSAATLIFQWRTGRPSMFVCRGFCSFLTAIIGAHVAVCGRRWPGEECDDKGWTDIRLVFRILHIAAALRMTMNGTSLFLQFRYPHRMFLSHGNEQLFYRGCIQATGVPINIMRGVLKVSILTGTEFERLPVEVAVNFIRAFVTIPISSGSLFSQWWYTSKGSTGHPTSDAYERLLDPTIDCPMERVQVSIVEARGLRKADLLSDSDPFCVCQVLGRPESTWQTAWKQNTHDPEWNEMRELVTYRKQDSIEFSVYDYDDGFWCIADSKDFLGKATLKSDQFHPAGFHGVLPLEGAGKGKQSTIKVIVELLDTSERPSMMQEQAFQPVAGINSAVIIDVDSLPQSQAESDKFWICIRPPSVWSEKLELGKQP